MDIDANETKKKAMQWKATMKPGEREARKDGCIESAERCKSGAVYMALVQASK